MVGVHEGLVIPRVASFGFIFALPEASGRHFASRLLKFCEQGLPRPGWAVDLTNRVCSRVIGALQIGRPVLSLQRPHHPGWFHIRLSCFSRFALFLVVPATLFAGQITIPIPNQGWKITLDAPPFAIQQGQQQGPNFVFRANSGKFNLSIFVEPQAKPGGSKECYEYYCALSQRNPLIDPERRRRHEPTTGWSTTWVRARSCSET